MRLRPARQRLRLIKLGLLATAAVASGFLAPRFFLPADAGQAVLALHQGRTSQPPTGAAAPRKPFAEAGDTASLPRLVNASRTAEIQTDPGHSDAQAIESATVESPSASLAPLGSVVEIASVSATPDPPAAPAEPAPASAPAAPRNVLAATPPVQVKLPAAQPIPVSSREVEGLVARARELLDHGNIAGARLVLERALAGRDGRVLMALAETYDPVMLSRWGARGVKGDLDKARELYREAAERGVAEARARVLASR